MTDISLRQIQAVIAVFEEGSFTRAAARENATQSGISQHIAAVERSLGLKLFERQTGGVKPTPAGQSYYRRCIDAVGRIENAHEEARSFASVVAGDLRIGLMPTMTRAALAPTLEQFTPRYPDVRLHIVEGYSGRLTEMVLADELDFAVVPTFEGRVGLKTRLIARDREMLLSNPSRGLKHLAPIRLKDLGPLKLVVPSRANIRRRNIEIYLETHGVEIADIMEMDAMIGTIQFVARSDWVTILSALFCFTDIERNERIVSPLSDPPLLAEYIVISQARRALSTQARLFLDVFEAEINRIGEIWARKIPPNVFPERAPRSSPRKRGPSTTERSSRPGFPLARE